MNDETFRFGPSPKVATVFAIFLAALHFGLAIWFASITPYRQSGRILSAKGQPVADIGNPDERQHANYIDYLSKSKGFPVFNPKDPHLFEDYQFHQPPLYYVIGEGWAKLVQVKSVNDQTSGTKLRALNALIGASEVLAVFFLGFWGFRKPAVGLCAASFAAFLPMNVALSASISNDPLLFTLCTAALAFCAHAIWSGWSNKLALTVGILTGLALLTKTTALALLPAILVAVLLSGSNRPKPSAWISAILPILLIPLGWWLRNQTLYGDPFAISAFNQAFVGSPQAKVFIEGFGLFGYLTTWVGWWTLRSFYGAFGYMDIWLNETGYPMGQAPNLLYRLLIMATFVVGLGWISSLKTEQEKPAKAVQAMNGVFLLTIGLLFLKFNMQYFQAQARYLLPAIGPISCGFGLGTLALFKGRWQAALLALTLVFGGTTVYAGTRLPSEFEKRAGDF